MSVGSRQGIFPPHLPVFLFLPNGFSWFAADLKLESVLCELSVVASDVEWIPSSSWHIARLDSECKPMVVCLPLSLRSDSSLSLYMI